MWQEPDFHTLRLMAKKFWVSVLDLALCGRLCDQPPTSLAAGALRFEPPSKCSRAQMEVLTRCVSAQERPTFIWPAKPLVILSIQP